MNYTFKTLMAIILLTGFSSTSLAANCPAGWTESPIGNAGYCCDNLSDSSNSPISCVSPYTTKSNQSGGHYCCRLSN